ncbi:alpha-ketoglutarate-dependent dioxygenase [Pandoraea terrae]|uniref:Alpha-ketoglutarate-dependent dioxygenase n=1 Tax=Pandoraea terrae TaxID=1537710 RepID=A0A5E4V5X6_9BURK|nr:DNA oxidative demethylase AlkB [Pandoraea terrae]VVE07481.1 alpha-ketoglutarate-dependent dioxygenase [Pandoraea terrae]
MADLFDTDTDPNPRELVLADGAMLLRGYALDYADALQAGIDAVVAAAPLRHWETPGGKRMSVAMTNCGQFGWISDRRGYRYGTHDPLSDRPWPPMPAAFLALAQAAARDAGFSGFMPDACLVNRYVGDARLTLHQDRDERDLGAPIVSVSLGLSAAFLWGGAKRSDRPRRVPLNDGDVVVWGGPSRLAYHGVASIGGGTDPRYGDARFNLTFRQAR